MMMVIGAVSATLNATPGYAQGTPAPAPPPAAAQQPPAAPPTGQKPAPPPTVPPAAVTPAPQPPRPFPEGAKVAFVDIQAIATNSVEGKSASSKLDAFRKKTNDALVAKSTSL